jgi:peptidoglycan hydrolase-like amidase
MWSVKNQPKITVGIMKIGSEQAEESIRETCGMVITYQNEICDARYSKAYGGGLTEEFDTAWTTT